MSRPISLAHLTTIDLAPPEMIRLAADLGYDAVGLRLMRVTPDTPGYPLMDDPAMMRATRAALTQTGLRVQDIEFVRINPDFDPAPLAGFLAAGAELGAQQVICAPYDPDLSRLSASLARMAEACRSHGLQAVLEFFPWTPVPDLRTALDVIAASGAPDLGLLVDTLHFDRSGSRIADLAAALPRMPFLHLCDAPVQPSYTTEDLFFAGRVERLPPGEGQIALAPILRALPPDMPVALEIPMTALTRAQGPGAAAARAIKATRQLLDRLA
ncbi:Sugar phosphate isomerase/epimerase [Paracoccus halophilus]|uniref:Endonuclease n=1 Tax=Paracoccus halophilus TaxID=376733 RepID=A0A099EWY4_9RHOB|nr:sugar phosphate isomerase/epimerase family protein [Paracoccus halophilus]KGJ02749.1 endonuclease [Paracoccus halophilus]SFA60336.1 Sugar phosphate isomerase/epimerase [Paracoccus halophilus]